MNNSHDEIKNLLKASRNMLSNNRINEQISDIKSKYGIITEQGSDLASDNISKPMNIAKSVEDKIEDENEPNRDKSQGYRISGGILVLHGKDSSDLELTTDDKTAFQETMDEFVEEVSDLVDFNTLNVYPNNVDWSGKIIDEDIDFTFTIGENSGIYVDGQMIKVDEDFLEVLNKLQQFYEKFKSKWGKVLASRKKTQESPE